MSSTRTLSVLFKTNLKVFAESKQPLEVMADYRALFMGLLVDKKLPMLSTAQEELLKSGQPCPVDTKVSFVGSTFFKVNMRTPAQAQKAMELAMQGKFEDALKESFSRNLFEGDERPLNGQGVSISLALSKDKQYVNIQSGYALKALPKADAMDFSFLFDDVETTATESDEDLMPTASKAKAEKPF